MEFHLDCGFEIYLDEIYQRYTFSTFLEGDSESMHQHELQHHHRHAKRVWPSLTFHTLNLDFYKKSGNIFPDIQCIGWFHASQPAREKESDFSELGIIWFESDFFPHITEKNISFLKQVKWSDLAEDGRY
jgi:hypothetical protein